MILFVLSSIYTKPFGGVGRSDWSGRLTIAEIFGTLALVTFFFDLIHRKKTFILPSIIKAYLVFIFFITLEIIPSLNPEQTLIEGVIHIYLGLMFIILINAFLSKESLNALITSFALASLIASVIGIFNLLMVSIGGTPLLVKQIENPGLAIGTFNNTGQAGAYMLVVLAVLLPLKFSPLYNHLSPLQKIVINIALITDLAFLVLTVKLAAYIGFSIGFVLFLVFGILKNRIKIYRFVKSLFLIALISIFAFLYFKNNVFDWYQWFQYKTLSPQKHNIVITRLMSNYSQALRAFEEHPIFGTGLGGFEKNYHSHEVHSTYLKVFSEAGVLGALGYALFMFFVIKIFGGIKSVENEYRAFLDIAIYFFIGCLVSWAYTYHLRKREFWIMLAILWLSNHFAEQEVDENEHYIS
ncbi:MAG: O-antigen ligase family protein [Candidatus Bilamarchaeaceae archaeon]